MCCNLYPWKSLLIVEYAAIGTGLGIQPLRMHMYTWLHRPYLTRDIVGLYAQVLD
jgi:hypothetical protein